MSNVDGGAVVRRDLTIVLSNATVAALMGPIGVTPDWPVIAGMATGLTFLLAAASDRNKVGLWALLTVGSFAMLALGIAAIIGSVPAGKLPPAVGGIALGSGLNRVMFGVVTPLPEYRLQREQAG